MSDERETAAQLLARIKQARGVRSCILALREASVAELQVKIDEVVKMNDTLGLALQHDLELISPEGRLVERMTTLGWEAGLWQLGGGILACGLNLAPDVEDEGFMCYLMADHGINGFWQVGFYRANGDESEPTWKIDVDELPDAEQIRSVAASLDHLLRTFGHQPSAFGAITTQEEAS